MEKVYGGVRAVRKQEVPLFTHRMELHTQEKKRIARYAQKLVRDGDILYIDAGTTAMHLIDWFFQFVFHVSGDVKPSIRGHAGSAHKGLPAPVAGQKLQGPPIGHDCD